MKSVSDRELIIDAFKVISVSMMQVIIFVTLYEAAVEIYVSNFGDMNKIFGFGMQINMAALLMSVLAGTNSVVQVYANNIMLRMTIPLVCGAVWIAFWGNIVDVVP